jgi:integrase
MTSRGLVLALWYTGARPSEWLSATVGDIDRAGAVWVYRPRTHKCQWRGQGREILIGRMGQRVLRRFLDGRSAGEPVFPGQHGHYTDTGLRSVIRLAALRACVPQWSPYQLRHAFISRMASSLGQERAAKYAGQKSIQATRRYDHQSFDATDIDAMRRAG